MANVRTFQRSFAGGEVTPELYGRIDDAKYQSGLALCRNFVTTPHGPAQNRPGFAFVREVKDSAKAVRLLPFTYSTTQTMVLEFGDGYLRFHTTGATLLAGSQPAHLGEVEVVSVDTSADELSTLGNHLYPDGSPIRFFTTGTLPSPLVAGTTYYIKEGGLTDFLKVSATLDGVAIDITDAGSGVHSFARVYEQGDIVQQVGVVYYCMVTETTEDTSNTGHWYPIPSPAYEIPTPYLHTELFCIHYVQSADVLTIAHQNHAPMELRRLGATKWVLKTIDFDPVISAPTGLTAVASGHTEVKYTYNYTVTSVAADGISESTEAPGVSVGGNLYESGGGGKVTISWNAVSGASRYNVYKLSGGIYGFIGQTEGTSIVDDNIQADLSKTFPRYETVFNGPGAYPAAVSYFEQRRCFAGTTEKPHNIWMTRSGTESNMSYSLPVKDDDRISFRVSAREANTIRHIVPLTQLLLLTSSAEWRVSSLNSDAITPTTISVRPQSYVGASDVQPAIINNTLIYCASRGGHVRELAYQYQAGGFITGDLSLRAPHLFDGFDIVDMAYSKAPIPLVWFVSTSGKLIGLTYVPEQTVGAWHQHDTDGVFESCTVVAEGMEDVLYVVVRRTIGGQTKRYVERMATRAVSSIEDSFFVDSGATYDGAETSTISGLSWLEGKTVSILADGAVHPQQVVTGGAISLEHPASKVHVGLPITADLQTLPFAAQMDNGFGQGRVKNVSRAWLRVHQSSGVSVGPSVDRLTQAKQRTTEPYGAPPSLKTAEIQLAITPSWSDAGQVFVRQDNPLPLTVVSLTLETETGG